MTIQTTQTIYDEMIAHMQREGGRPSSWYAGITEDIDARLFGDHNVPRKGHWFVYRRAQSHQAARAVERALLQYGCDGGTGGGDVDARFVYAYKKTSITIP